MRCNFSPDITGEGLKVASAIHGEFASGFMSGLEGSRVTVNIILWYLNELTFLLGGQGDLFERSRLTPSNAIEKRLDVGAGYGNMFVTTAIVDDKIFPDDYGTTGVDHTRLTIIFIPFFRLKQRGSGSVKDFRWIFKIKDHSAEFVLSRIARIGAVVKQEPA